MATADDDTPEIATNEEWRAIMSRARKDQKLTQEQVADAVHTSQVMISKIESGAAGSSTYILPICRLLNIPPPQHFAEEWQQRWSQLGHVLRSKSPEQQEAAMRLLEAMTGIQAPQIVAPDPVIKPK